MTETSQWKAEIFRNIDRLDERLASIRKLLIGRSLTDVRTSRAPASISLERNKTSIELTGPLIICLNGKPFEIEFLEFSCVRISIDFPGFSLRSGANDAPDWTSLAPFGLQDMMGDRLHDIRAVSARGMRCPQSVKSDVEALEDSTAIVRHLADGVPLPANFRPIADMFGGVEFVFESNRKFSVRSPSKGTLLQCSPVWLEQQELDSRGWEIFSKEESPTYDELIERSNPNDDREFSVACVLNDVGLEFTFKSARGVSWLWVAESVNNVPYVFRFLEAVADTHEGSCYFHCDEEGPDSLLRTTCLSGSKIRFVHVSDRWSYSPGGAVAYTGMIRQDIILDRYQFVSRMYRAIREAARRVDPEEAQYSFQAELFNQMKAGSWFLERCL